jgi:hypothetical protein
LVVVLPVPTHDTANLIAKLLVVPAQVVANLVIVLLIVVAASKLPVSAQAIANLQLLPAKVVIRTRWRRKQEKLKQASPLPATRSLQGPRTHICLSHDKRSFLVIRSR